MNNWEKSINKINDDLVGWRLDFTKYIDQSTRYNGYRFFWELIPMINFVTGHKGIAWTDRNVNIFLNIPHADVELDEQKWEFIYYHECLHQMFETFGVEDSIKKEFGKCNHDLLNVASDVVINDYLKINCSLDYPTTDLMTPEYIKEKFGVDYDRKKDDQYDLYMKLKEVEDKIVDDPLVQKMREGAPKIDMDSDGGSQNTPKTVKIPTSDDWKRGSKEARKAANDILEKFCKNIKKQSNGKVSVADTLTALTKASSEIEKLAKGKLKPVVVQVPPTESVGYVMSSAMFIGEAESAANEVSDKYQTYDQGWDYAIGDVLRRISNMQQGLMGGGGGGGQDDNEQMHQEVPDNDPTEESPFLPQMPGGSSSKSDSSDDSDQEDVSDMDADDAADEAQKAADKAKDSADKAKDAADKAQKAADNAKDAAEDAKDEHGENSKEYSDAKSKADKAQKSANKAKSAAGKAQEAADKAQDAADESRDAANKDDTDGARSKAKDAQKNANEAAKQSSNAEDAANDAEHNSGKSMNQKDLEHNDVSDMDANEAAAEAQNAADQAQEMADDAKMSANGAQASADKAREAAEQAKGEHGENSKEYSEAKAKADSAQKNADKSKSAAAKAQKSADKAQECADKAKDAANKGDEQGARDNARDAQRNADKAAREAAEAADSSDDAESDSNEKVEKGKTDDELGTGEENVVGNADEVSWNSESRQKSHSWSGHREEIVRYAAKLGDMTTEDAKNVIKKFARSADKSLGEFVRKCVSSEEKNVRGIIVQTPMQKRNVSWAEKFSESVKNTVKQYVKRRTREFYATYRKPNRRQGVVKDDTILKKGKMRKKDKLTISVAFYIDISSSMDASEVYNIFTYAYKLNDYIVKQYKGNEVIDETVFDFYSFNGGVHKEKRPNIPRPNGTTLPLLELIKEIEGLTKDYMVNVIITDAEMGQFPVNKIKNEMMNLAGNLIFITDNTQVINVLSPLTKVTTFGSNKKFEFITVPKDFVITDKDFKQV